MYFDFSCNNFFIQCFPMWTNLTKPNGIWNVWFLIFLRFKSNFELFSDKIKKLHLDNEFILNKKNFNYKTWITNEFIYVCTLNCIVVVTVEFLGFAKSFISLTGLNMPNVCIKSNWASPMAHYKVQPKTIKETIEFKRLVT